MILIDALYINDGGGKVLLDYLMSELEKSENDVWYLLDERIQGKAPEVKETNKVTFMKGDLMRRNSFYGSNGDQFTSVLCFGNLPPNIRLTGKVYTYFHQLLYLALPADMVFKKKILYWLKTMILNRIKNNTDFWIVQTTLVKEGLKNKYRLNPEKILELPFYPPFPETQIPAREKSTYLYVSNATPHKNHQRLINAFCRFYDQTRTGKLILTVNEDYPELLQFIKQIQDKNYPIENVGFVSREVLAKLYKSTEYLIHPSHSESFGLGLVEAIENGCKVIGADLPYTFAVCEPSLTFNPLKVDSIVEALSLSLQETKQSVSKVKNEIATLTNLLH